LESELCRGAACLLAPPRLLLARRVALCALHHCWGRPGADVYVEQVPVRPACAAVHLCSASVVVGGRRQLQVVVDSSRRWVVVVVGGCRR
jgi:hypothetical protein